MIYKFRFLLVLLVILNISPAFAQFEYTPGIKVGFCKSSFKTEQLENSSRNGFMIGINYVATYSDYLDIIAETEYLQKGAIVQAIGNPNYDYNVLIHSYNTSLLGNYYIKYPYLSLQFGFSFGIFNIMKENYNDQYAKFVNPSNAQNPLNAPDFHNSLLSAKADYSLAFGISTGIDRLKLNIRYNYGISNVLKKYPLNNGGISLKNNFIQLSVSYSFIQLRSEDIFQFRSIN